jgi:hypothetical protein
LSVDWKRLSREAGLRLSADGITIACGGDRSHIVRVDERAGDAVRLWSIVVSRGAAPSDAALQAWKINRFRELVGFKVAEYGRVIGECWVPAAGVSAPEWKLYVETLAHACDRLEYLWTGRDVE